MGLGKSITCVLFSILSCQLLAAQHFAELAVETEMVESDESSAINSEVVDELGENFCLSAGLLKHYRCDSNTIESQIAAGQRYSIQLLVEGENLPQLPEALALFHRTQLSGEKAFVYVGEFTKQQEALDTMTALVMVGTLEPDVWRPAVVQVDKSREVPGVRLVKMYKDKSFSQATIAAAASDPLSYSGQISGSGKILPSYYTVQLASFEEIDKRNEFISQYSFDQPLLCRQRRNGRHTVYSGAFSLEKDAQARRKELQARIKKAYVLRLKQEDMFSCDSSRNLMVFSRPESVAKARPNQSPYLETYFTAQIASFSDAQDRLKFVRKNSQVDFSCRTRRNGKYVAYSGAFATREELKIHIRRLHRKGLNAYQLKLQAEDMFDCENDERVVLYSKTSPSKNLQSGESTTSSIARPASSVAAMPASIVPSEKRNGPKVEIKSPEENEGNDNERASGKHVSGLQSLAKVNLGDSSISQALSKGGLSTVRREGVVQLNVIAPEKNKEPRLMTVPEEEASELPAYYQRRPIEGALLNRQLAKAGGEQQNKQGAKREHVVDSDESSSQEVVSLDADTLTVKLAAKESTEQGNIKGRLANDWQPSSSETFYTVQLATFKGPINEGRFVKRHQELDPLCRVRRNGQLAVYSGKFLDFESARGYLRGLGGQLDGYVVMLQGELLPPCSI